MKPMKSAARSVLEFLSTYHPAHQEALQLRKIERRAAPRSVEPSTRHLDGAISWLKRAQDSGSSGGVAWGYRTRRPVRSTIPLGWVPAYPETTGYIIPTMLRYAELTGDADCVDRARRMTKWELEIQLTDGGIQGGIYGAQPVESSTFVTGQVLFGFTAAYQKFGDDRIRQGALRAGDFLLSCLGADGGFLKGHSHFCAPGAKSYEARTGLALAELGDLVSEPKYRDAASRIADHALSNQEANGWFRENDTEFHETPLTHTIGYVLEGLHGIGTRLGRPECIRAVRRTLDNLLPLIREDGYLAGRWYKNWTPAANWACLTGSAQIAGVFIRMSRECENPHYFDAGRKMLGFVCFTQDIEVRLPGLDGGIRGTYPFHGGYGQWCVLNWATKFFADSVMDYLVARNKSLQSTEVRLSS